MPGRDRDESDEWGLEDEWEGPGDAIIGAGSVREGEVMRELVRWMRVVEATHASVAVRHELYEDAVHIFQTYPFLYASRRAFMSIGDFVRMLSAQANCALGGRAEVGLEQEIGLTVSRVGQPRRSPRRASQRRRRRRRRGIPAGARRGSSSLPPITDNDDNDNTHTDDELDVAAAKPAPLPTEPAPTSALRRIQSALPRSTTTPAARPCVGTADEGGWRDQAELDHLRRGHWRVRDIHSAETLFEEMVASRGYCAPVPPFNTMMQLYKTTKPNRDPALFHCNQLRAVNISPTAYTYKLLMDAYGRIKLVEIETMEQIWEALRNDPAVEIRGEHFASLINTYSYVQKDLDKAIAVLSSILTGSI
ncbi:hypothetical protein B0H11DRAFT_2399666 [Mycena galericulata]|nr:hypothetical protein B0H11DRAFT_2399666 [Mycena galericulata]